MNMTNDELNKVVAQIQCSETFGKLMNLSQTLPVDTNNKDELKTALTNCIMELTRAMDNNRIHFSKDEDAAIFHGLLTVCLAIIFDGKVNAEKMMMQ